MATKLHKKIKQELKQPSTHHQGDLPFSLPAFVTRSDIDAESIMDLWNVTELTPSSQDQNTNQVEH